MDSSGFGLKWKGWKGKGISEFNFRAINLYLSWTLKVFFLKGFIIIMLSMISRNDFKNFIVNHPWYRMKRKWPISFLLNMTVNILSHWWNDVLPSLGDCLWFQRVFGKRERGDGSVHLNHVKSLTGVVRSLVIYSKWYTSSWIWWAR